MKNTQDASMDCAATRLLARQAIIETPGGTLPPEAEEHLAGCSRCRCEVEALSDLDERLSRALGSLRGRIRPAGARDIDRILEGIRERPPAAVLMGRIRRSVRRMLFLTLLVLSFLAVAGIAWALVEAWKATR